MMSITGSIKLTILFNPVLDSFCVLFFQLGSYFLTNLCLVVVATQFSETRQRESALMEEARLKARSTSSTIFTGTDTESSKGCYNQLLSMIKHFVQRGCRQLKTKLFGENKKHQLAAKHQHRRKKKRRLDNTNPANLQGGGRKYQYGNGGGDVHYHHHHHHHIHHHHLHLCNNNNQQPPSPLPQHQQRMLTATGVGVGGCEPRVHNSNGDMNMGGDETRFVEMHVL